MAAALGEAWAGFAGGLAGVMDALVSQVRDFYNMIKDPAALINGFSQMGASIQKMCEAEAPVGPKPTATCIGIFIMGMIKSMLADIEKRMEDYNIFDATGEEGFHLAFQNGYYVGFAIGFVIMMLATTGAGGALAAKSGINALKALDKLNDIIDPISGISKLTSKLGPVKNLGKGLKSSLGSAVAKARGIGAQMVDKIKDAWGKVGSGFATKLQNKGKKFYAWLDNGLENVGKFLGKTRCKVRAAGFAVAYVMTEALAPKCDPFNGNIHGLTDAGKAKLGRIAGETENGDAFLAAQQKFGRGKLADDLNGATPVYKSGPVAGKKSQDNVVYRSDTDVELMEMKEMQDGVAITDVNQLGDSLDGAKQLDPQTAAITRPNNQGPLDVQPGWDKTLTVDARKRTWTVSDLSQLETDIVQHQLTSGYRFRHSVVLIFKDSSGADMWFRIIVNP